MLFLRCVSTKDGLTGFVVIWTVYQPLHVRYIGPQRVEHIYLLRLHDSLEVMLFKYGGDAVSIRQPAEHNPTYKAMFGYRNAIVTATASCLCAIALQQGPICIVTEMPCFYGLVEPGCALWRL